MRPLHKHPGRTRPARSTRHRSQRGAALIMVLLIVSILMVVVLESLRTSQVELASTSSLEHGLQADSMVQSGLSMVRMLLVEDMRLDLQQEEQVDHNGEPWSLFPEQDDVPLPEMHEEFNGTVVDEQAKFPINALVDQNGSMSLEHQSVLTNLLTAPPFAVEPEEADLVILSIKDWLDEDDEASGEEGAEYDYYQGLEQAYMCKNGPMTVLGELLLVRGITEELFYGIEDSPGLRDLLTVHGPGTINFNTAPALILAACVKQDETGINHEDALDFAEEMVKYRNNSFHWDQLGSEQWFTNVAGSLSFHFHELMTTTSSFFSARVTAASGVTRRNLFAVLERKRVEDESGREMIEIRTTYLEIQ